MTRETTSLVLYEVNDGLATISMNRPEVLNAMSREMLSELLDVLDRYDRDDSAFAAILHGVGGAFCAGADIKQRFAAGDEESRHHVGTPRSIQSTGILGYCVNYKPIVAAVHGYCFGLGAGLAAEADLIVATETAKFGITETKRGIPGARVWARMAAFMPSKVATEMALTGEPVAAPELYRLGLINRLVPDGEHLAAAEVLARSLMVPPPLAMRAGVRFTRWTWRQSLGEADMFTHAMRLDHSADFRESNTAFVAKRTPQYRGE